MAGNGTAGFNGDGIAATSARLNVPYGVAVDGGGNLFIADQTNQRIRKVDTSGIITTVAGNGTAGFAGDGGAATSAQLNFPRGVAVDGSGNLFIADQVNQRIRKVAGVGAAVAPPPPPPPTITGLSVRMGAQGTTVSTTITGTNLSGASIDFGSGISANPRGSSDTSLMVDLTIRPEATLGPRSFSVFTGAGSTNSGTIKFTVLAPGPTITSLSVGSGAQGATVTTTISGTNLAGATSADFGAGISVTLGANTATSLTVTLTIDASAASGARTFSVTTPSGTGSSGSVTFTVVAPPPAEPPPPPPPPAPGVDRMVPITPVDAPTQRDVGQALGQLLQSAGPVLITQAPDSGVLTVQTAEGRQLSALPLRVRSASGLHRAAAPSVTLDPFFGTAFVTTAQGTQVELMGAPPDLASFLALLRPLGVTGLTIDEGHFLLRTADPMVTGIVRLDFELMSGASPPGAQARPDGTAQLTYPGGRTQAAVPVFIDLYDVLALLPTLPGATNVQPQADGTVRAVVNGQPQRLRPAFGATSVGPSGATNKRQILQETPGTFTFSNPDGRRQRFTIVP